jgi:hypothetical protein
MLEILGGVKAPPPDSLCMYTLCFFRNIPLISCTLPASPRWRFFAVVTSARVAPLVGAIEPMREVHFRKSCESAKVADKVIENGMKLTRVISIV